MIALLLQTVLLLAAGFALFRLWRAATPSDRWLRLTVAAGFLSRAIAGQALFWISWRHLAIARSLQLGNGLWMYAQDALYYASGAGWAAMQGPAAILFYNRTEPSVTYVQTLAVAMSLFGTATSVAVLLNLFCYLGLIAILVRWTKDEPRAQRAVALIIAGVSLAPSFILWSLQPLKDTLFQLLFVAFVALCARWQRSFMTRGGWPARGAIAVLMAVVLYTLSGIRWYVGFVLLAVAAGFFVLVIIRSPERKSVAAAAAAVTVIVLSRVFLWSAEPYLPPPLVTALNPITALRSARSAPASIMTQMERTREAFDRQPGATKIRSAARVTTAAATVAAAAPPRESARPAVRRPPAQTPSRIARLLSGLAAIVFPWRIGEWLGLFHIGGGRGLIWLTEVDTLIFDFALVCAFLALAVRSSVPWRNPLTWLVLAMTLLLAVPLAYSISNFGTLFRLREIVFLGLLLTPLAVATAPMRRAEA